MSNKVNYADGDTNDFYDGQTALLKYDTDNRTLAQWRTRTGEAAAPLDRDPLPLSTSDFHLQSGSPAKNTGTDVGITLDLDGKLIRGNPDMGAFEYHTPPRSFGYFWIHE
jgi:hypothetical protein